LQALGGSVSPLVSALVRITTNPRAFQPVPAEAFTFCDYLLEQPNCQTVEPGGALEIFNGSVPKRIREARASPTRGSPRYYRSRCEWITLDRDYGVFRD
jgi:hypothetical protein